MCVHTHSHCNGTVCVHIYVCVLCRVFLLYTHCVLRVLPNKQIPSHVSNRVQVQTSTGETFAKNTEALFMETSAKDGRNVQELFRTIGMYTINTITRNGAHFARPTPCLANP